MFSDLLREPILPEVDVHPWPIATDHFLVADCRFRGITDMAGAAAGRTQTRMT
jgi:hypothetical protein